MMATPAKMMRNFFEGRQRRFASLMSSKYDDSETSVQDVFPITLSIAQMTRATFDTTVEGGTAVGNGAPFLIDAFGDECAHRKRWIGGTSDGIASTHSDNRLVKTRFDGLGMSM